MSLFIELYDECPCTDAPFPHVHHTTAFYAENHDYKPIEWSYDSYYPPIWQIAGVDLTRKTEHDVTQTQHISAHGTGRPTSSVLTDIMRIINDVRENTYLYYGALNEFTGETCNDTVSQLLYPLQSLKHVLMKFPNKIVVFYR